MPDVVVGLRGVAKSYRGHGTVLAGIDLELRASAPVAVVGANGTGKSTLLRIVAGCAAPSAGRVTGRPPVVGYVPATAPAESPRPARSWLRHQARLGGARSADPHAVLAALAFAGDLDAGLAELSTGDLRKVELAAALSAGAGLLVLDEPWSGLDAAARPALDALLAGAAPTAALLVADHTGRGAALPGARAFDLRSGRLTPAATGLRPTTVVRLDCADPGAVRRALDAAAEPVPGGLVLRVPAERGDALLVAALQLGCSVRSVHREGVP